GSAMRFHEVKSGIVAAVLLCAVVGCAPFRSVPLSSPFGAAGESRLRVGSVELHRCPFEGGYYCGALRVALDPAGRVPGTIDIAIAWLPQVNRAARNEGTIVAVEGGPGYPSIGSRSYYHALYAPLLETRNLLLVDNRGTGTSSPIVCNPLQRAPVMVLPAVTRCGHELGRRSDLYGTAIAADDMAKVLVAMRIPKVDMYGDSYGSFFVQAFAARHPETVRSLVLDGAYQVTGGNPWYPSEGPTMQSAFNIACRRSPVCASRRGTTHDRIKALLAKLRADHAGVRASDVAFIMDSAGLDPLTYRDLDAAARAYVRNDDRVPLRRLADEAYAEEEGAGGHARAYSQGLFVAASCSDNPQAYDMRLQPPARTIGWRHALERKREEHPTIYAPFTLDEFLGMPLDYAYVPLCTTWPVASLQHPAGHPVPPHTKFPRVPVLVLNGDLDTTTTPAEGVRAAQLFPRATQVIVANTGHVTALDDFYGCASAIVRRFTLTQRVDAGCAAHVPALHLVPSFARTLDEVEPATPLRGNQASTAELRAAAAATLAAADVLARSYAFSLSAGPGLRGGSYTAQPKTGGTSALLSAIRWTKDLAVSGSASLDARTAQAEAVLTLADGATGSLDAEWTTSGSNAAAVIHGTIDGRVTRASMPAP
ncbi:MAG: alpha/beta fold hydrolase, partial [Candidatus Cybelea sp.]